MRSARAIREDLARCILHLRSGRADCRRSLARLMRLSPSTAGSYVEQLLAAEFIRETRTTAAGRGRPRRLLRLVGTAGWFAGVEFHAKRIQVVAFHFAGQTLRSELAQLPDAVTTRQILNTIVRIVGRFQKDWTQPLLGLGVGAPGVVDPEAGVARSYAFVADWREVPVVDRLQQQLGVPVTLENNLRATATAERWFGAGRQLTDFVVVGARSGFGVAIVLGGRLWTGSQLAAGEVGHWPTGTGDSGQLHDSLSAPAVWRRLSGATHRQRPPTDLKKQLARLADPGSPLFQDVVSDYAHFLTRVHLLLDAAAYLLHGPLTALGPAFCQAVVSEAVRLAPQFSHRPPCFEPTLLDDDAGAVGAGCHAMEAWQPPLP